MRRQSGHNKETECILPESGMGCPLNRVNQERSVPDVSYTAEEFAEFVERFDRVPSWRDWQRRNGLNGEDVLEISVEGDKPLTLKVAKTEESNYLATGFDGWALTVAERFSDILDILARMSPKRGHARSISWPVKSTT